MRTVGVLHALQHFERNRPPFFTDFCIFSVKTVTVIGSLRLVLRKTVTVISSPRLILRKTVTVIGSLRLILQKTVTVISSLMSILRKTVTVIGSQRPRIAIFSIFCLSKGSDEQFFLFFVHPRPWISSFRRFLQI